MKSLFLTVLNMSITGAVVILAILVARLLLKKAPKKYSYLLWALAAFRLICPFSFRSVFSVFNLSVFNVTNKEDLPLPAMNFVHDAEKIMPSSNVIATVESNYSAQMPSYDNDPIVNFTDIALMIWLLGIIVMLIWATVSLIKVKAFTKNAVKAYENIYTAENIVSPFVFGVIKPKIFIPASLSGNELEYVISHERIHIKRGDHIVKMLASLILCIHWFNPLCWLAFNLMTKDMEMSCDEKVLKDNENIKKDYSMTLLSFASGKKINVAGPLAFGESAVKSRIKNVLSYKKPWALFSLIAVLVIIVMFIITANPATQMMSALVPGLTCNELISNRTSLSVSFTNGYLKADLENDSIDDFLTEFNSVKISSYEVSKNIDEFDDRTNIIYLSFDNDSDSFIDNITKIILNESYTRFYVDDGVKPSYIYEVKEPEKMRKLCDISDLPYDKVNLDFNKMLEFYEITDQQMGKVKLEINMKDMPELEKIPISEKYEPREIVYMDNKGLKVYGDDMNEIYLTSLYRDREYVNSDEGYIGINFHVINNMNSNGTLINTFWYNEGDGTYTIGDFMENSGIDIEDNGSNYYDVINAIGYGGGNSILISMRTEDYAKLKEQMNFKLNIVELSVEKKNK